MTKLSNADHLRGPFARTICKDHLQGPFARTICEDQGPFARTICEDHLRGPFARTICEDHLRGPFARTICEDHLRGPFARTLISVQIFRWIGTFSKFHWLHNPTHNPTHTPLPDVAIGNLYFHNLHTEISFGNILYSLSIAMVARCCPIPSSMIIEIIIFVIYILI